jgi:CRP/FNR family transcriptional regulator
MTGSIKKESFLTTVEPFKHLPAPEQEVLFKLAKETRYAKGETIFREGDPCHAVWVVKTGRVHLMKFLSDGKVSTTCVMASGDPFCCLPALDRKAYPVDAVAAEESLLFSVPIEAFHKAMVASPIFSQQTLCLFCERLREVEHRSCMLHEAAEVRLAQVLLTLSKKFGQTIPLTRTELAEIAGTTPETAIRTLSRFKARGLIVSSRGKTTLLNPKQLSDLLKKS